MTRDDIIHMAREAGILVPSYGDHIKHLEAFAALVAAAERETCAAVCFRQPLTDEQIETLADGIAWDDFNHDFARAIERAHGITGETK